MNMLALNIEKIKNKQFEDEEETKLSRQKINILKELQIKIDNKIYACHSKNQKMDRMELLFSLQILICSLMRCQSEEICLVE